ncbi:uncharacterized protein N7459_009493 [Penicillium hispanicum]|uniref:uncharacterized protein n=1 Tax=Penicillium hispanicum TaxID=1080232 RepID=UPI0025424B67|nr:uncharacterized protein N7459_009493 [Penicillium hispanicum]KAJ5570063.1 hypothetical protein N7459_009493 [Penicillium hispanicum]
MSLNEIWEAASTSPFQPLVDKESQFVIGFNLLLAGTDTALQLQSHSLTLFIPALLLTGIFGLNRSFGNLVTLGVPASLLFGFGAVLMICAVGVYV